MWDLALYDWLPYTLAAVASATTLVAVRLRIRNQRRAGEELLSQRRKAQLLAIRQKAFRHLPEDGAIAALAAGNGPAVEPSPSLAAQSEPDRIDIQSAPPEVVTAAVGDPVAIHFLYQIRFFEERFEAELDSAERRIVDSVLEDSFSLDPSFASWWKEVRVHWRNQDFVHHVDTLHPTLSTS